MCSLVRPLISLLYFWSAGQLVNSTPPVNLSLSASRQQQLLDTSLANMVCSVRKPLRAASLLRSNILLPQAWKLIDTFWIFLQKNSSSQIGWVKIWVFHWNVHCFLYLRVLVCTQCESDHPYLMSSEWTSKVIHFISSVTLHFRPRFILCEMPQNGTVLFVRGQFWKNCMYKGRSCDTIFKISCCP